VKPKPIVQIQTALALVAAIAAIALCGRAGATGVLIATGLGLILTLGLVARYQRMERDRPRSAHRAQRDRAMLACLAGGFALPIIASLAVLSGALPNQHPPLDGVPAHFAAIAANAVFAVMLTCSFFDWYLIRPFRDRVLGRPVRQMAEHDVRRSSSMPARGSRTVCSPRALAGAPRRSC